MGPGNHRNPTCSQGTGGRCSVGAWDQDRKGGWWRGEALQCSKGHLHWPGSGDSVGLSRGCGGSEPPSCALWEVSPLAKDREVYGPVSQNLTLSLHFCLLSLPVKGSGRYWMFVGTEASAFKKSNVLASLPGQGLEFTGFSICRAGSLAGEGTHLLHRVLQGRGKGAILRLLENLLWASVLCLSCHLWLVLHRWAGRPEESG